MSEYAPYKMDELIFNKSRYQIYSESLENYCLYLEIF